MSRVNNNRTARCADGITGIAMACAAVFATAAGAQSVEAPAATPCTEIVDDAARLVCYDRAAGRAAVAPTQAVPAGRTPQSVAPPEAVAPAGNGLAVSGPRPSFLSKFWELDEADKRGAFNFTGYRPNYLLPIHVSHRVNDTPFSPSRGVASTPNDYQKVETKIQISLRTKVAQDLLLPGADLWFAYTQQAFWQLYNQADSRPFRGTDYEPEAIYMVPVPASLQTLPFGWKWRYGQLAIAHQSNGQSDPLSRSWNRSYLGLGFEHDSVSLSYRLNRRFQEDADKDDNPDLVDYRGRHEFLLAWTPGRSTAALAWRTNFNKLSRGAVQLDWTYPVFRDSTRALRWYAQVFTGYGETLIDYNVRQTSVGLGLTLFEF